MSNTVYVNVNGVWKQATDYYVNVNGTWKTGTVFSANVSGTWKGATAAPPSGVSLPDYLDLASLDYAEFGCLPIVDVAAKSGLNTNTLDYAYFGVKPVWALPSSFVYQPPSGGGGGSTPTNVLPKYNSSNITLDDFIEFQCKPLVHIPANSTISTLPLQYAEYTCKPFASNDNSYTYTAPTSNYGAVTGLSGYHPYGYAAGQLLHLNGIAYKVVAGRDLDTYIIGNHAYPISNNYTGNGTGLKIEVTHNGSSGALQDNTTSPPTYDGGVLIKDGGGGYVVGDHVKIKHNVQNKIFWYNSGNLTTANSTRAAVAGNTYTVYITPAMTSGNGYGQTYYLTVKTDGSIDTSTIYGSGSFDYDNLGQDYAINETVTIPDSLVGNTGAPDLTLSIQDIVDDGWEAIRTVTSVTSAPTPPASILPDSDSSGTLDIAEFSVKPQAFMTAKSTIDSSTLDYAEYQVLPMYTQPY